MLLQFVVHLQFLFLVVDWLVRPNSFRTFHPVPIFLPWPEPQIVPDVGCDVRSIVEEPKDAKWSSREKFVTVLWASNVEWNCPLIRPAFADTAKNKEGEPVVQSSRSWVDKAVMTKVPRTVAEPKQLHRTFQVAARNLLYLSAGRRRRRKPEHRSSRVLLPAYEKRLCFDRERPHRCRPRGIF